MHVIDFPGSAQSFVLMARHAGNQDASDRYDAQVANYKFAGSFMSRLNLNLREDKGYTYGARGGYSRYRQAGQYRMYAKVKGDTTRASIDEMRKELRDVVGDRPMTQKERDEAVNSLLKGFPGQFERGGALASMLVNLAAAKRPADALQSWPSKIANVSLESAQGVLSRDMQLDDFVLVVAGDWTKIKSSLEGIGLPILMHGPDGKPLATGE